MFPEEFEKLDHIAELAAKALRVGKPEQAKRHFNKLRRSPFVIEAQRAEARAHLEYFKDQKDGPGARRCVRRSIGYLWGEPQLLSASNFMNSPISDESKLFRIQFTGTTVMLGAFSAYDNRYICTFEAIATSSAEAVRHFLELIPVDDVRTMRIIKVETLKFSPDAVQYEGLIRTYPFRIASAREQLRGPLVHMKAYRPESDDEDLPIPSPAFSALMSEMMSSCQEDSAS